MLKGKKILLAVTGSISYYKSFEILSRLKKLGADVFVALSDGALDFVGELGFEALSTHTVLSKKTQNLTGAIDHILYSKVDLIIIAPASVNTINKLSAGICDSTFMATLIAGSNVPTIIAPAANDKMLEHFATKNSLNLLKNNGYHIMEPVTKTLACGDVGKGGLADVEDIVNFASRVLLQDEFYEGKTVVVTGGPTSEKIDDVRAVTNFSSGKMAKALADAFYYLGADVKFISSIDFKVPYKIIKFESSAGLESAIKSLKLRKDDILMMAAAVSDYIPTRKVQGKMKKSELGTNWNLGLRENIDILSSLKDKKFKKIGFKLETDMQNAITNAKRALVDKGLDGICLNVIDDKLKFGSNDTKVDFITQDSEISIKRGLKLNVAFEIAALLKAACR